SLPLVPQPGLQPLARNKAGLWQFLLLGTGAPPTRVGLDGTFRIDEDSGIVLVMLPGGQVHMGWDGVGQCQGERAVEENEAERTVSIRPFLLGSHEVTQAQWLRATGVNPSRRSPEYPDVVTYTLCHPVESVTWYESERFAARLFARLPSEAELEHAGRAA